MLKLINEFNLKYCPCSIELIYKWNLFLIGTYELSEDANPSINKRFGSFALIDHSTEIILEQNCRNGGVFDFCIVQPNCSIDSKKNSSIGRFENKSFKDQSNCVQVYSAHSNGNLTVYEIVKTDCEFKLNEVNSISTGSSMLTCLDLILINEDVLVIVGDSNSTLTLIKNKKIIKRFQINQFDYPIWSIKLFNKNEFRFESSSEDQFLLFTGSDDCVLRCFVLKNSFQDHLQLFNDDSFEGGVTSIEIIKNINEEQVFEDEKKLNEIRDEINKISNYKVLVGSYDEKLRIFSLNTPISIKLDETVSISNAGIWRIKHLDNFQLITGMYSGIHLMKNNKLIYTFNDLPINDEKEVDKENEHLIYGCCFNLNLSYLLITSFYKKKVYCLELDKNLIELLKD